MNIKLIETTYCPVCGQSDSRIKIFHLQRTDVYRCSCGLEFISPSLDEKAQMEIYQSSETLREINPALENYYEYDFLDKNSLTVKDYDKSLRCLASLTSGRELMEVGCGTGPFLKFAKNLGWTVYGVDSSIANIEKLQKEGIESQCSNFLTFRPERKFDAIILWDLIEHPQEPLKFLQHCQRLLKPDGLLLLATPYYPNLLSLLAGWFYRWSGGRIVSPIQKLYFLEHTSYFGSKTLCRLLERGQFFIMKSWKTETDLKRYNFPLGIKIILYLSFFVARLFNLQNRFILIARK